MKTHVLAMREQVEAMQGKSHAETLKRLDAVLSSHHLVHQAAEKARAEARRLKTYQKNRDEAVYDTTFSNYVFREVSRHVGESNSLLNRAKDEVEAAKAAETAKAAEASKKETRTDTETQGQSVDGRNVQPVDAAPGPMTVMLPDAPPDAPPANQNSMWYIGGAVVGALALYFLMKE